MFEFFPCPLLLLSCIACSWVMMSLSREARKWNTLLKKINDENTNDDVMLYNWCDNDESMSRPTTYHNEEKGWWWWWCSGLVEDQPKFKPFPTISIENPTHCWSPMHFALLSLSPAKIADKKM